VANSRSAKKRIRANEAKHIRNRTVRSAVRTRVATVRKLAVSGTAVASELTAQLVTAVSSLDKAAEKGVLHRNNVARRKSRLMAQIAAIMKAAEGSAEQVEIATAKVAGRTVRKPAAAAKSVKAKAKPKTTTTAAAKKAPTVKKATTKAPAKKA